MVAVMTRRQRVLDALNHVPPDRVPVDLGGHRSSGIMAVAYAKLKKALGITSGEIYVYDMVQQLAIVEEPVLEALGIDAVEMGRGFLQKHTDWKDWVLPDGTLCKIPYYVSVEKLSKGWVLLADDGRELGCQYNGSLYFEQTHYPMAERDFENDPFDDLAEQMRFTQWTAVPHPGAHIPFNQPGLQQMAEAARNFRQNTDRAIVGLFGGNMFEIPQYLVGQERYYSYMGEYPDAIERFSSKLCELHMANLEKWLAAVGPYIDVVLFGDDLGCQLGPLFSLDMYRDYYKPYHERLWKGAKKLAPHVKVNLHSCGDVQMYMEDFIEAGLDAINPVQISCKGMDAQELKRKYAGRMVFWGGGCDTQNVLATASPEEIRRHVKQQAEILGQGGGFVFQQVHNIMANVPPENILAMYEGLGSLK